MVFEEDFSKFISGMKETLEFIKKNQANRKIMDQNDDFDQDNIVMNIDNNSDIEQVKVVANPDISSDISEIIA
jgi:hypothetical protein